MTEVSEINKLIEKELEEANKVHGPFSSWHEAYAVILEEVEETKKEVSLMDWHLSHVWNTIKKDQPSIDNLAFVRECAIDAAREAIQVVAMCDKALDLVDGE